MIPSPAGGSPAPSRSLLARVAGALAAALVALVLLPLGATPPAFAADNGQYGVNPSKLPDAAPDQLPRPFFQPALTPGVTVADSITITNSTDRELSFSLYPADAFNTPTGGFSLRPKHE